MHNSCMASSHRIVHRIPDFASGEHREAGQRLIDSVIRGQQPNESGEIRFGDGLAGRRPQAGERLIARYQHCDGAAARTWSMPTSWSI